MAIALPIEAQMDAGVEPEDALDSEVTPVEVEANPYDDVVDDGSSGANPYESIVQDAQLNDSLAYAKLGNPETVAQAMGVSRRLEAPESLVEDDLDGWLKIDNERQADARIETSAAMSRAFKNPEFSRIAYDDTEELGVVERAANYTVGLAETFYRQTQNMVMGQLQMQADMFAESDQPELLKGMTERFNASLKETIKSNRLRIQKITPEDMGVIETGVRGGLISIPQVGLAFAMSGGNPLAVITLMGGGAAGEAYSSGVDAGLTKEQARMRALLHGTLEGAGEYAPIKMLTVIYKSFGKELGKKILQGWALEVAGENLTELGQSFTDYYFDLDKQWNAASTWQEKAKIQLEKQAVASIAATVGWGGLTAPAAIRDFKDKRSLSNIDPKARDIILNGMVAGESMAEIDKKLKNYDIDLPAIIPKMQRMLGRDESLDEARANATVNYFKKLGEAVKESKVYQRDKVKIEEFITHALADNPDATVDIDIEGATTFFQQIGVDPVEGLIEFGLHPEEAVRAFNTNKDVTVPIARFAANAGSQYYDGMVQNVRMEKGQPTYNEVEQKNAEAALKDEETVIKENAKRVEKAKKILDRRKNEKEFTESATAVHDYISQQAQAAGRSKEEAEGVAMIWKAFTVTLADSENLMPMDILGIREPEIQGGGSAVGDYLQSVWHGSPHKWDKVDLSKVGTGEGAQAYGWGFYSAADKGVAESYVGSSGGVTPQNYIRAFGDEGKAIARIEWEINDLAKNKGLGEKDVNITTRKQVIEDIKSGNWDEGHLYKLDIDDSVVDRMLDYDAVMSEQPESVQIALKGMVPKHRVLAGNFLVDNPSGERMVISSGKSELTGRDIQLIIMAGLSEGNTREAQKKTSLLLDSIGIPGIKYFDGNGTSRKDSSGTRNYVVFNEKNITVLSRNGKPVENQSEAKQEFLPDDARVLSASASFNQSTFRPEVVTWAQEKWGDQTAPDGSSIWQNFVEWFGDSKIVNPDGTPMEVYHGTDADFEKFYPWSHLGTIEQSNQRGNEVTIGPGGTKTIPAFLSISNPFEMPDVGEFDDAATVAWTVGERLGIDGFYDLVEAAVNKRSQDKGFSIIENELRHRGYDGVIYENEEEGDGGSSYIAFNPNQIKSSIGNQGTFSTDDARVLYQNDLVVTHNLSAENLKHADEIGGLASPSLAVQGAETGFEGFGEISLLALPEMIGDRTIPFFSSDIYSPRHPRVSYDIDYKGLEELNEEIKVDSSWLEPPYHDSVENRGVEELLNNEALQFHWLKQQGIAPATKKEALGKWQKKAIAYAKKNDLNYYQYRNDAGFKAIMKDYFSQGTSLGGKVSTMAISNFIATVDNYIKTDGVDPVGTRNALRKKMRVKKNAAAFEKYAQEVFDGLVTREKMFTGTSPTTGAKRFKDYTLDNVVAQMKKEGMQGSESFHYGGAGYVRSAVAQPLRSIKAVQKMRGKILSREEMEKIKEESGIKHDELLENLKRYYKFDSTNWNYDQDAESTIMEYALGKSRLSEAFDMTGGEVQKMVNDHLAYLAGLPTEYFEGKAKRAVSISEFDTAIVPKNSSKETKQILRDAGVKIRLYDQGKAGDRARVVGQQKRVLFQSTSDALKDPHYRESLQSMADSLQKGGGQETFKVVDVSRESGDKTSYLRTPSHDRMMMPWFGDLGSDVTRADVQGAVKAALLGKRKLGSKQQMIIDEMVKEISVNSQVGENPMLGNVRGSITFEPDRAIIDLFNAANESTLIHESAHYFLQVYADLTASGQASPKVQSEVDTLLTWFNIDSLDQMETSHHELFARGFERYMAEGNAPSPALQNIFDRFASWLIDIYKSLKAINAPINDDVRGMMDAMLAGEAGRKHGARQRAGKRNAEIAAAQEPAEPPPPSDSPANDGGERPNAPLPAAERTWNDRIDGFRFQVQDKLIDLRRQQERITAEHGTIDDLANAYQRAAIWEGRAGEQLNDFDEGVVEPLLQAMAETGLSIEEIGSWLVARHAEEANEYLAEINPDIDPDVRYRLSGMSNEESSVILAEHAENGSLSDVGRRIDAINRDRVALLVESGLMTQQMADLWQGRYEKYVPLHREEMESDSGLPARGQGFQIKGKESKMRTGSAYLTPSKIVTNVLAQYEASIVRAEKNRVGQAVLELVENYPDPDYWEVVQSPTQRFVRDGKVVESGRSMEYPHEMKVKREGHEVIISFNRDNKRAMRLVDGLKNLSAAEMNGVIGVMAKATRFLSQINTSWNPEFIISNFFRDVQTAGYNLSNTELKGKALKVIRRVPKAIAGIRKALRTETENEWTRWYEDFRVHGGKTGWIDIGRDLETKEVNVEKAVERLRAGKQTKNGFKRFMEAVDDYNTSVENGVRLVIYRESVEMGLSREKAAAIAKDATVNFNRKGMMGPQINALYMFANAGMQGSVRLLQAMKTKRGQTLVAGTVGIAIITDILNRAVSDDDDDGRNLYDEIPNYIKAHNFIIMGEKEPIAKIPLPWGYNVFHVLGQSIGEAISGEDFRPLTAAADLAISAIDAFNPLGTGSFVQVVAPTLIDPSVQIAENKNFAGIPVKPEQLPFGVPKPPSEQYFQSVTGASKYVTGEINKLTGGNEFRPGAVSVSPEHVDLAMAFVFGGAGRTAMNTVDTIQRLVTGQELPTKNIPFARRVTGYDSSNGVKSRYYEWSKDAGYSAKELKGITVHSQEWYEASNRPAASDDVQKALKTSHKALTKLRKTRRSQMKNKDTEAELKVTDDKIRSVMGEFNKVYIKNVINHVEES